MTTPPTNEAPKPKLTAEAIEAWRTRANGAVDHMLRTQNVLREWGTVLTMSLDNAEAMMRSGLQQLAEAQSACEEARVEERTAWTSRDYWRSKAIALEARLAAPGAALREAARVVCENAESDLPRITIDTDMMKGPLGHLRVHNQFIADLRKALEAAPGEGREVGGADDDDFTPGCKPPPHPLGEVHRWAKVAADGGYHFPGKPELRRALAAEPTATPPVARRVRVGSPAHVALWNAINEVVYASGGRDNTSGARMNAVVNVEKAMAELLAEAPQPVARRDALVRLRYALDHFDTFHGGHLKREDVEAAIDSEIREIDRLAAGAAEEIGDAFSVFLRTKGERDYTMQVSEDLGSRVRGIAACLTYNRSKEEGAAKHMLYEVASRIRSRQVRDQAKEKKLGGAGWEEDVDDAPGWTKNLAVRLSVVGNYSDPKMGSVSRDVQALRDAVLALAERVSG